MSRARSQPSPRDGRRVVLHGHAWRVVGAAVPEARPEAIAEPAGRHEVAASAAAGPEHSPWCIVVGGPNGAGKTTFALEYLPRYADCREFVNPDLIAAGLSPLDPPAAGVRAGRLVLERIGALAARRVSFGFETTCSGRGHLATLSRLKTTGYRVCLILVWVSTLDLCAARIACRVRAGGHGVPEADQRRRFARILANLRQYRALADRFVVIENGGPGPVLVYECSESGGLIIDPERFRRISQEVHL